MFFKTKKGNNKLEKWIKKFKDDLFMDKMKYLIYLQSYVSIDLGKISNWWKGAK